MNFNKRLKCNSCDQFIDCRIGMSNRDDQPIRFACPSCAEPIYIIVTGNLLEENLNFDIRSATEVSFEGPFDNSYPFVDLHIDFPVAFGEYEQGKTPFLVTHARIGHEKFIYHNRRLNALNSLYKLSPELKRALRIYFSNQKLFSKIIKKSFDVDVKSKKQADIYAALYELIAKAFHPFTTPTLDEDCVNLYLATTIDLSENKNKEFVGFINDIDKYLDQLQKDCVRIYPRIFDLELPLRSALYLDVDPTYDADTLPLRISTGDFEKHKEIYKDISELLSRLLVLVAGVNNLIHRSDHNSFKTKISTLNDFANVAFGQKTNHLDDCWYSALDDSIDNQFRNAIAHYKTEYDESTQIITYYTGKKGMDKGDENQSMYLDFVRKVLISYREMHRLHHLVKNLLYYRVLILKK